MRPQSIKRFEILYGISLLLSVLGTILSWNATLAQFQQGAGVPLSPSILIGILVFGYAVALLLLYFTAHRASNVAKWILVAFALLGLIGLPALVMPPLTLIKIVGLLSQLVTIASLVFLFKADTRTWFAGSDLDDEDEMGASFE